MEGITSGAVLIVGAIIAVLAVIVWAFYKAFKDADDDIKGMIEPEDVTLLSAGMQDPMLGVAAYTAGTANRKRGRGGADLDGGGVDLDLGDDGVDITPVIAAAASIMHSDGPAEPAPEPVVSHSEPATSVFEHHEAPAPEPVSHINESVFTHHESPAPSHYESSGGYESSSCGSSDCGSCGGGD